MHNYSRSHKATFIPVEFNSLPFTSAASGLNWHPKIAFHSQRRKLCVRIKLKKKIHLFIYLTYWNFTQLCYVGWTQENRQDFFSVKIQFDEKQGNYFYFVGFIWDIHHDNKIQVQTIVKRDTIAFSAKYICLLSDVTINVHS